MTSDFIPKAFLNAQRLPLQELKAPTFCSSSKAAKIEAWANSLQATKISHTSVVLYKSIPELNKVKTDWDNRFKTLEAVRPAIQNCIQGLTKDFLHQPLTLSGDAQKYAIIAQALQKYMVDGYMLCARDICNLTRFKPETIAALTTILHRAITGIGLFFFRSYQLYTTAPTGMWQLLHGLYQIAEYYDLLRTPVSDSTIFSTGQTDIRDAWLRIAMLASCKPNQLCQNDVAHAYSIFSQWAALVKTHEGISKDKDNFYIINISRDEAPCYKSRFNGSEADRVIELDFKALLGRLAKQSDGDDLPLDAQAASLVPKEFPDTLVNHLLNTWGNIAQRKLGRRDVNLSADIAVGLVDCHYFLAGKRKFDDFINGNSDWEQAGSSFTPRGGSTQVASAAERPTWSVKVQNVSAGGYCLMWKGDIPPKLESGEVICLKENNRFSWNLGVVRWIKQLKNASQIGVQLLSSHASVCGAAQILDTGGQSDYMRALILPPNNTANLPSSVLTPRAPFGERQKAKLMSSDQTVSVRLGKCLFSTGSVKQFAYTEMEGSAVQNTNSPSGAANATPDSFDSSWDDI